MNRLDPGTLALSTAALGMTFLGACGAPDESRLGDLPGVQAAVTTSAIKYNDLADFFQPGYFP